MFFSRASQYAIRALTYLAQRHDSFCPLEEIAKKEGIPQPFLGKVLQGLAHKRLVRSSKGLNGGFALRLSPNQITLHAIVDAVENLSIKQNDCVLGLKICNEENPCALHHYWKEHRVRQLEFLNGVTLHDLCLQNGDVPEEKK